MPGIFVSAVITDGANLLYTTGADGGSTAASLPGCELTASASSIEDALAAYLRDELGIEVAEQEFLETLYELDGAGCALRLNNLQLVAGWSGTPVARTTAGVATKWVPLASLPELELSAQLKACLLAAFGLADAETDARPAGAGTLSGSVFVITGPAGAGKSTVAALVAGQLERSALIRLDDLAHMVVSGRPVPHWQGGDAVASRRLWDLAQRNAAMLARNFAEDGYTSVIEGVLEQPSELAQLLQHLDGVEVYYVTLLPVLEELLRRDAGRAADRQMGGRARELHELFTARSANAVDPGMVVDSSAMSPAATAQFLLDHRDEARVEWIPFQ